MVLEWCSQLSLANHDASPIRCGPLDPESVQLVYTPKTATLAVIIPSVYHAEETLALDAVHEFIGQLIGPMSQYKKEIETLPKRLAKLFKWHHLRQGAIAAPAPQLPQDIATSKRVFYTSTWQHYMPDPFIVRRTQESILVLSRSQTQRLNLDCGDIMTEYEGQCVYDTHARLYRVSESDFCYLDRSGNAIWRVSLQFEALAHELYAYDESVIVAEHEQLTSFDIVTGQREWCVDATVLTLRVFGTWLYSIEQDNGIAVRRRPCATPTDIECLYQSDRVVQYWWLEDYLVLCPTQRTDELCTHIVFINLKTGQAITHRLPPLRPVSMATSAVSIAILFEGGTQRHIFIFHRYKSDIRLLTLSLPAIPSHIIHLDESSVIMACRGNTLLSMQLDTLSIGWVHQLDTPFPIDLQHTLMHQKLLIVPGGPILVIDSKSGRTLSAIDDPLYANARPLLVDEQRILLHDEAGYLGQFTVQGHIGLALSNP